MKKQQIKIFDTTLRDGQQCPGAGMSMAKNLKYARLAKAIGVDILEAGFPSASQLDFNIVQAITQEYSAEHESPIVAALCQLREPQVEKTIQALSAAIKVNKARLHVYLPVDPQLMQASLGKYGHDKKNIINDLNRLITLAVAAGCDVEFSPEGYSRMTENFGFVTDLIRAAVSAGANVINCPDTIGGACQLQGDEYFVEKMKQHAAMIKREFPDQEITWSAHCHNDFGLALANTMNAVFTGPARQIEGCFNGIGERAGNAALEQCIMCIEQFGENSLTGKSFYTNIATEKIQKISDFVAENMLPRQPHWPITGENAAKHSSGGHTNAIIKNPTVYQPFDPKKVGKELTLLFGPLSGSNHAQAIIEKHGYQCQPHEKQVISQYIKDHFQDRRKGITDTELMSAYFTYRSSTHCAKSKNIVDKIWEAHVIQQHEGHPAIFAIDFTLLHEVTSAQAFQTIEQRDLKIFDPSRFLATIDHSIPTRTNRTVIYDKIAKKQVDTLRADVKKHSIKLYDFDSGHQGIVHVIGPELGITQPGMTIVCGDSHTATHGAFGALAFGIGTSVLSHVMATGCMLLKKPKVMQVKFNGYFQTGVYAKDAIMKLITEIGIGGATGYVIEYTGDAIKAMTMEERMTICNMSIECGAIAGLISPDQTTYDYIKGRQYAPSVQAWQQSITAWNTFKSDSNAQYDKTVMIDLSTLEPMVTWGTNPEQAIQITENIPSIQSLPQNKQALAMQALDYIQLKAASAISDVAIDWAFIGSCTNGRIEDLRVAAKILQGKKIHDEVTMYVVPGSEAVRKQAQKEGLDQIFLAAGAEFRMPGCSLCLGMNDDKIPPGKRCISTTNRNFIGRQGIGSFTHLASPATVAASAITGRITSVKNIMEVSYEENA